MVADFRWAFMRGGPALPLQRKKHRVSTSHESEMSVPQSSKNGKRADSSRKIRMFFCKIARNQAQMSPFVSGNLSSCPLFSCTSPEVPSFLTSLVLGSPARHFTLCLDAKVVAIPPTGSGATRSCVPLALHRTVGAAKGPNRKRSSGHASISVFDPGLELSAFIFRYIMARLK